MRTWNKRMSRVRCTSVGRRRPGHPFIPLESCAPMTLITDSPHATPTPPPLSSTPLVERWSPRAYDPTAVVDPDVLRTILEAARWAPSANNVQPWRFVVARRGTDVFTTVHDNHGLQPGLGRLGRRAHREHRRDRRRRGQARARGRATTSARPSPTSRCRRSTRACTPTRWAASTPPKLHEAFGLDERFEVVSVTTIGVLGDAARCPTCCASARSPRARACRSTRSCSVGVASAARSRARTANGPSRRTSRRAVPRGVSGSPRPRCAARRRSPAGARPRARGRRAAAGPRRRRRR